MQGPTEELRASIVDELAAAFGEAEVGVADVLDEDRLEGALGHILEAINDASTATPKPFETPADSLAAIEAWAALASYAVARVYAPASPWPVGSAAWDERIVKRLRKIANKLKDELEKAARHLKPESFSVSVGYPWGVSISEARPVSSPSMLDPLHQAPPADG
jgi:hypothetical protein